MKVVQQRLQQPESPFTRIQQPIQKMLQEWVTTKQLKFEQRFALAPSRTNRCTRKFQYQDFYYQCFQCVVENQSKTNSFYLCVDCFNPEDHIGHYYKCDVVKNRESGIFCACGKDLNGQDASIQYCNNHTCDKIQGVIEQQRKVQFIEYFKDLFQIIAYLHSMQFDKQDKRVEQYTQCFYQLLRSVMSNLAELTKNSVGYARACTQLLAKKPISIQMNNNSNQSITILELFSELKFCTLESSYETLFLNLLADDQSALILFQELDRIHEESGRDKINQYMTSRLNIEFFYISEKIIEELAEQNQYIKFLFYPGYSIYCKRKKNGIILMKAIRKLIRSETMQKNQVVNMVSEFMRKSDPNCLTEADQMFLVEYFLGFFELNQEEGNGGQNGDAKPNQINENSNNGVNKIKIVPEPQSLQKQVLQNQPAEQSNEQDAGIENSPIQQYQISVSHSLQNLGLNSNSQTQIQEADFSIFSEVIGERIYGFFKGQKTAILKCRQVLEERGIKLGNIEKFIDWSVENIDFGGSLELIPSKFVITTILLMVNSPQYQKYVEAFWKSVFYENHFIPVMRNLWSLFFLLTDQKLLRWTYKSICYPDIYNRIILDTNAKLDDPQAISIDQMQKQYLYQFKQIPQHEMGQLRLILDNQRFCEIVRDYCKFQRQKNAFIYNSTEQHPNKMIILLKAIETLKNNQYKKFSYIESQETIASMNNISKQEEDLRAKLFINTHFFDNIIKLKTDMINQLQDREERIAEFMESKRIESYLQILVIVHNICGGKFEQLRQHIQQIRNDQDKLNQLLLLGEKKQIMKILSIDPSESNIDNIESMNEAESLEAIKKKAENKKNKIMKSWKERRKNAIDKLSTSSLSLAPAQSIEEEEECIICHEKSKPDNQLVYMIDIVKESTLCTAIFKEKNCASTFMTSCFHPLHLQCFIKNRGPNRYLRCPLCNKPQNSIFPINYKSQSYRLNTICQNIMKTAAITIYGVYDIDDLFRLFLEFLIESKGFFSLIEPKRYEDRKKKKQKLELFIEKSMESMYEQADAPEKMLLDRSIERLSKRIMECQDQDFQIIQKSIFDAIVSRIRTGKCEINIEKILQISKRIKGEEFQIIRNQIEDLGHEPIELSHEPSQYQNTQLKEKKEQRSIAFTPIKLPETWDQIPKFGAQKCDICASIQKSMVCLICGQTLCDNCASSENHETKHKKRALSFLFHQSTVSVRTQCSSLQSDIYFNQLRTSIRKFDESSMTYDEFKLDTLVYNKLNEIFIDDA